MVSGCVRKLPRLWWYVYKLIIRSKYQLMIRLIIECSKYKPILLLLLLVLKVLAMLSLIDFLIYPDLSHFFYPSSISFVLILHPFWKSIYLIHCTQLIQSTELILRLYQELLFLKNKLGVSFSAFFWMFLLAGEHQAFCFLSCTGIKFWYVSSSRMWHRNFVP